jgi:hypothetical protein
MVLMMYLIFLVFGWENKVEQAKKKPSFESHGRHKLPPLSRTKVPQRSLRCGRGGSGTPRGRSSREGCLGNILRFKDANIGSKTSKFT